MLIEIREAVAVKALPEFYNVTQCASCHVYLQEKDYTYLLHQLALTKLQLGHGLTGPII